MYQSLCHDVSDWYDKYYMGDVQTMKNLHIHKLTELYDPFDFKDGNIRAKRIEFLTMVQGVVDMAKDG